MPRKSDAANRPDSVATADLRRSTRILQSKTYQSPPQKSLTPQPRLRSKRQVNPPPPPSSSPMSKNPSLKNSKSSNGSSVGRKPLKIGSNQADTVQDLRRSPRFSVSKDPQIVGGGCRPLLSKPEKRSSFGQGQICLNTSGGSEGAKVNSLSLQRSMGTRKVIVCGLPAAPSIPVRGRPPRNKLCVGKSGQSAAERRVLSKGSGTCCSPFTPRPEKRLASVDTMEATTNRDVPLTPFAAQSERRITRSLTAPFRNQRKIDAEKVRLMAIESKEDSRMQSGGLDNAICSYSSPVTPHAGKKIVGVKRKRKEIDGGCQGRAGRGWTKEQEKALQSAYFAAKPTPNFWKKVSKLVPGKSAQDCFDKVQSEIITPPVSHPRSRTKGKHLSPQCEISFSGVFDAKSKSKKKTQKTSTKAQKTVRDLLRKNSHLIQKDEADMFHLLEPSANALSAQASIPSPLLSTPVSKVGKWSSPRYGGRSSSGHKKSLSRPSGTTGTPITSPPVLKPIKNIALHDKYIDKLHAREAKRKAALSSRNRKLVSIQIGGNRSQNKTKDAVIRAAKDCLVYDAMDAIAKFRHSQVNLMDNCSDSEEIFADEDDEDEAET